MSRAAVTTHLPQRRAAAERLAAALPPLLIAAARTAQAVLHGEHGRRRAGPGDAFWQYRPYGPGDAAADIDWRKSARAERVLVRETEWMAANTLWIWVQNDPGMRWRSHLTMTDKAERAWLIALTLATLAVKAGERIAPLGGPLRPDHTRHAVENLARHLDQDNAAVPPLADIARFSTCLLIGDFFADPEVLEARIRRLAANGATGHLLQVVDPAEESFPFHGRTRFERPGGADHVEFGRAEEVRDGYRRELAALRARLKDLARRIGWTFSLHRTDQPPQTAVLALHERITNAGAAP